MNRHVGEGKKRAESMFVEARGILSNRKEVRDVADWTWLAESISYTGNNNSKYVHVGRNMRIYMSCCQWSLLHLSSLVEI